MEMGAPRALAVHVAAKVIRHARNLRNIHEEKLLCLDCKLLPKTPVTGRCGHTRCLMCIKKNGSCPCGAPQPDFLNSNILVRDIIENLISKQSITRISAPSTPNALIVNNDCMSEVSLVPSDWPGLLLTRSGPRLRRKLKGRSSLMNIKGCSLRRLLSSPQMRYDYACELVSSGRFLEAAPHFAVVAASSVPYARSAKLLLVQVISNMCPVRDPRHLIHPLYRSVRQQSLTGCIDPAMVECPVCYNVMEQPVTVTCGHTFCRCCIKRSMQRRDRCPLCSISLKDFSPDQTEDTEFVCAVQGKSVVKPRMDPDFIPIFVCTVAFPDIPCPLMFDTDFRDVIRGVLDSGSRRFGMVASLGNTASNHGTIVEVRDCLVSEDGRTILSTVGISRFLVIEKITINGCPYARIQEHADIVPIPGVASMFELELLARQIRFKVQRWLPSLDEALRMDIDTWLGSFPQMNLEGQWWDNPNGPNWLWWLIAILPLRTEIQMLMLATKHLSKRMTAVLRTFDAIDYNSYTSLLTRP